MDPEQRRKRTRGTAQLSAKIADCSTPIRESPAQKRQKNRNMQNSKRVSVPPPKEPFELGEEELDKAVGEIVQDIQKTGTFGNPAESSEELESPDKYPYCCFKKIGEREYECLFKGGHKNSVVKCTLGSNSHLHTHCGYHSKVL